MVTRKNKKPLLYIFFVFLVAFLLRCILINWTLQFGNNGDFTRYEDWARISHIYNLADTYKTDHLSFDKSFPNNQPPGSLYILSGTYELWILTGKIITHITHSSAGSNIWVNTILQHIFMKSPMLITDLLMGFFIYLLVEKSSGKKYGIFAASLVILNPVIFYNSAIWGQMDSINNLLFVLSIFFAFRKNILFSIFSYAFSLYIKLSLLPLLPFYLIFILFLSNKNYKKIILGIILSISSLLIITYPISLHPIAWSIHELPIIAKGEIQSMTVAAFNFWFMVTCFPSICNIPDITTKFFGITFNLWGYGIFAVFVLPLIYLQIKKSKQFILKENIILLFSIIIFLVFIFLPNMHDRYMYPVFPLLAIFLGLTKQTKSWFIIFIFLSLFNLDNIVYSWYPIPLSPTTNFYHIFYGHYLRWIISILTVTVGLWFYLKCINKFLKLND